MLLKHRINPFGEYSEKCCDVSFTNDEKEWLNDHNIKLGHVDVFLNHRNRDKCEFCVKSSVGQMCKVFQCRPENLFVRLLDDIKSYEDEEVTLVMPEE